MSKDILIHDFCAFKDSVHQKMSGASKDEISRLSIALSYLLADLQVVRNARVARKERAK